MIFLHLLLGLLLGKFLGHTILFVCASMLPDIDHIYIVCKHHLFTKRKLFDALRHEERYGVRFKTPFMHSLFGLLFCSLIFFIIAQNLQFTVYFALMYGSHLLLDWLDIDKKQYLYPFSKREFSGFLPIWSKTEKILTIASLMALYMLR